MPQRQIRILRGQRRRRRRGTQAPFAGAPACARASTSANAKDGGVSVKVRARSDEGRGGAEGAVGGFAEGRETVLVSDVAVGLVDVRAEEGAEPVADGGEASVAEEAADVGFEGVG